MYYASMQTYMQQNCSINNCTFKCRSPDFGCRVSTIWWQLSAVFEFVFLVSTGELCTWPYHNDCHLCPPLWLHMKKIMTFSLSIHMNVLLLQTVTPHHRKTKQFWHFSLDKYLMCININVTIWCKKQPVALQM